MNNLICTKLPRANVINISITKLRINTSKFYATQTAIKVSEDSDERMNNLLKEYERVSNITIKVRTKSPQKPPFVKNIFLGVFDTDILTYPQLEKADWENLNKQVEPIQKYFKEILPQQKFSLSSDFWENLKRLRLFGLQCPQVIGGRELTVTESCRLSDILANDTSTTTGLFTNEHLGIQAIRKLCTEEQKKKYLPKVTAGDVITAFCISERDVIDLNTIKTKATRSSDKQSWILNGEKLWVVNGGIADLLIVIAATEDINKFGLNENKLTAFLVEKDFGGITSQPCDVLGIEGTNICDITFNNTIVPFDNILGEMNTADSVLTSILTEFRLSTGPACSAILRQLTNNLINYCIEKNSDKNNMSEADYIRSAIAQLTTSLYAIESITYLTAGLIDEYENQDCQAESAIVKVFSSEATYASTLKCMNIIGSGAYMKDHWCNILHRNALSHHLLNEASENLKINIALMGLHHAGLQMQNNIKIVRNPLYYPSEIIKRAWTRRRQHADNPKLRLHLADYVHPSAIQTAQLLEYCVLRLEFASETLFARYGPEILNQHMDLKRMAECAIDIYVMTACLGRASRAYCIGLQHADDEMTIANTYCYAAMERIKYKINKIYDGPYSTNDESNRKIAKRAFHFGNYFPVHPLTRNY